MPSVTNDLGADRRTGFQLAYINDLFSVVALVRIIPLLNKCFNFYLYFVQIQ